VAQPAAGEDNPQQYDDFRGVLHRLQRHPNRQYFVLKSIVVNNLYGVDIIGEAVEIAKLRLFLKLVAQVEQAQDLEPLPDIDFNIRAGNTLVGFTTIAQVEQAMKVTPDGQTKLMFGEEVAILQRIVETAADVDRLFAAFQEMQTAQDTRDHAQDFMNMKQSLRLRLKDLECEMNLYLARQYAAAEAGPAQYRDWLASHHPFHWFTEFYGILGRGGFDVVVGNPPYVVYSRVRDRYTVRDYETEACGNLYAFATERAINLLHARGRLGFIIPVASVCTDEFAPLQKLLMRRGNLVISTYNDRPGRLFSGLEHSRLSIILCELTDLSAKTIFTTRYNRWHTAERPHLFETIAYVESTDFAVDGSIPKLSSELEKSVLHKVLSQRRSLGSYTRSAGRHPIYYTRKLSGFVQVMDSVPAVYDAQGNLRDPSELKRIPFDEESVRDVFLAILNSNLFYWMLTIYSDCRNLNMREIADARFDTEAASENTIRQLADLSHELMKDLKSGSRLMSMNYRSLGRLTIQCFYPKYAKPTIDRIDRVLAQRYGFTDQESDFIIDYDLKYRVGLDALSRVSE